MESSPLHSHPTPTGTIQLLEKEFQPIQIRRERWYRIYNFVPVHKVNSFRPLCEAI